MVTHSLDTIEHIIFHSRAPGSLSKRSKRPNTISALFSVKPLAPRTIAGETAARKNHNSQPLVSTSSHMMKKNHHYESTQNASNCVNWVMSGHFTITITGVVSSGSSGCYENFPVFKCGHVPARSCWQGQKPSCWWAQSTVTMSRRVSLCSGGGCGPTSASSAFLVLEGRPAVSPSGASLLAT